MGYKLVSYDGARGVRAGIIAGDRLIDAADASGNAAYTTALGVLSDWAAADTALAALAADAATKSGPIDWKVIRAPIPKPGAIYCAGANYGDHVREMNAAQGRGPEPDPHTLGLKPWHFIKSVHSVTGPGAAVKIPPLSKKLDWEVELAAVIGKTAKDVKEADALAYVAGYCVSNDLSARDFGFRPPVPPTSPFYSDWLAHKSFDGSCPLGPWMVPAADVGDPQKLGIRLWVNGTIKQDSNTAEMIYTLAEQIAQLSLRITLHPGDVILTGTPAGVGAGRNEFLKPGDSLELWCENVGTLKHTMA
ncbi:MAG TPA: fumarylacetoacetate hydrolase family protein [Candidatus Lustribacter sp.]|jgi:2-keto-4-pentenoate hydratase/2-oxohepta-3-ene-1,7-dioic acid hydratase in catechol pathway|nr:fumarylacetoacetate hydrolase family protein [Candidatus Lustribacter sp.]